jgi:hypothetical protein
VAEQAAREVSEGVSQRNVARGLEMNRDELFKEIETQVGRQAREALGMLTGSAEFKQQVVQIVRSGIQPVIETIARETAERTVQQSGQQSGADGASASRATLALVVGFIALLGAGAAIVGAVLKLF